jgi:hypothetical protein
VRWISTPACPPPPWCRRVRIRRVRTDRGHPSDQPKSRARLSSLSTSSGSALLGTAVPVSVSEVSSRRRPRLSTYRSHPHRFGMGDRTCRSTNPCWSTAGETSSHVAMRHSSDSGCSLRVQPQSQTLIVPFSLVVLILVVSIMVCISLLCTGRVRRHAPELRMGDFGVNCSISA